MKWRQLPIITGQLIKQSLKKTGLLTDEGIMLLKNTFFHCQKNGLIFNISVPTHIARNPKPIARTPKPAARNPKPIARAPKPAARNPKPIARDPKPIARKNGVREFIYMFSTEEIAKKWGTS
jgi:hypothetical protein